MEPPSEGGAHGSLEGRVVRTAHAATRLALGTILLGADGAREILETALGRAGTPALPAASEPAALPIAGDPQGTVVVVGDGGARSTGAARDSGTGPTTPSGAEETAPSADSPPKGPSAIEVSSKKEGDGFRHAVIGGALELEDQLIASAFGMARLGRDRLRGAGGVVRWASGTPAFRGLRARAEAEFARLMDRGAMEESRSRAVAGEAIAETVRRVTSGFMDQEFGDIYQRAMSRVSDSPEIAELVREQSLGIAGEMTDSVRARAVMGDAIVERVIGRIFRRHSRSSEASQDGEARN